MAALLPQLRSELTKAFGAPEYERQVEEQSNLVQQQVNQEIENLRKIARGEGLDIVQSPQGFSIVPVGPDGEQISSEGMPKAERKRLEEAAGILIVKCL